MKRWIGFAALFYPRGWREEFGPEFDALLDDVKPRWRVFANVLGGAITMHVTDGTNWLKVVAAAALLGAIVAGAASFRVAPQYVSSVVMSATPQADPVRPASPQVIQERAAERVAQMETEILSRMELFTIMNDPRLMLYQEERKRIPLEDIIAEMRRNIRIEARPSTDGPLAPIVFSISFLYPDQVKAQATVNLLASKFTELNMDNNKISEDAYRHFWGDMAALRHTKPAPPPPVGTIMGILDPASLPTESTRLYRLGFLVRGVGAGLLLGLLAALALQRPRGVRQLTGFAAAGLILACAASFLIPNRYTSTAVMQIMSPQITEDPTAPLPGATPAAEFLGKIEPDVLSFQTLSGIIQDPRLNLYSSERATRPMEEVVRNMLANDLRIAPVSPASAAKGTASAFTISFSYSDRYQAQQSVQALMNAFVEQNIMKQKAAADESKDFLLHTITQRKAGEVLGVLDTASLPVAPVSARRLVITLAGLGIGLLLGVIKLYRQRPRISAMQPA